MRTYKLHGEKTEKHGEFIVNEEQIFAALKLMLLPIWQALHLDPLEIAKYNGDIYALNGVIIGRIQTLQDENKTSRERLKRAEFEFRKLREERLDDLDTIKRFLKGKMREDDVEYGENVVKFEKRRKAA